MAYISDGSDLLDKNSHIARVRAKFYNYVINADNLNFMNTDNDYYVEFEVEPLEYGPVENN